MKRSSCILLAAAVVFMASIVLQSAMFAAARTEDELMAMAANPNLFWISLAAIIISGYGILLRRRGK